MKLFRPTLFLLLLSGSLLAATKPGDDPKVLKAQHALDVVKTDSATVEANYLKLTTDYNKQVEDLQKKYKADQDQLPVLQKILTDAGAADCPDQVFDANALVCADKPKK